MSWHCCPLSPCEHIFAKWLGEYIHLPCHCGMQAMGPPILHEGVFAHSSPRPSAASTPFIGWLVAEIDWLSGCLSVFSD